jgi:soluble lytic murein transglycosylase-like protein
VANRESGFNQEAMGSKGEIGVFQLMPSTASELGVNASNLEDNIIGGIAYLKKQYDR